MRNKSPLADRLIWLGEALQPVLTSSKKRNKARFRRTVPAADILDIVSSHVTKLERATTRLVEGANLLSSSVVDAPDVSEVTVHRIVGRVEACLGELHVTMTRSVHSAPVNPIGKTVTFRLTSIDSCSTSFTVGLSSLSRPSPIRFLPLISKDF